MRRIRTSILFLLVGLLGLAGCGERDPAREDLLDIIDDTREVAYRFVYIDDRPDHTTEVRGSIEDDFRLAARVAVDDAFAFDEVVFDDALALRFYQPELVTDYLDPRAPADVDVDTEIDGADAIDVLQSGRWVLDPRGAPLFVSSAAAEQSFGEDPVRDAMTVLDYVEQAIRESIAVEVYSPDDLSPIFSSSEDVFPKPPHGSAVTRYDLQRPPLPAVGVDTQGDGNNVFATRHFRKMVVYVQDGVVIRVLERIEIIGKQVGEVVNLQRRLFDELDLPEEIRDEFDELVDTTPEDEVGQFLIEFINFGLDSVGLQPILQRTMSVDLVDHGDFFAVALPNTEDETVVGGSLEAFTVSGYARADTSDQSTDPTDAETDTQTDADADTTEPDTEGSAGSGEESADVSSADGPGADDDGR